MPITKETAKELGSKGGKQRLKNEAERKQSWWDFVASGGLRRYRELHDKLANGEEINKWHEQFMDRTERNFPYIKAKKTDITTDGEKLSPVLVKFLNDDRDTK